MLKQAEQSPVAVGCQICCAPHRNDFWEKAKYLKEITVHTLLCADISYSTHVSLIYELPTHHAISSHGCLHFCQVYWLGLSPFSAAFRFRFKNTRTRFVKQNIKAHQHPLIKVSLNNTWLATSMGNQGSVATLTCQWPVIDSKNRVTVFTTETSN